MKRLIATKFALAVYFLNFASGCAVNQLKSYEFFSQPLTENFRPMEPNLYALNTDRVLRSKITQQRGYLITTEPFDNFILTVEYWAEHEANSGIYIRCQDSNAISSRSCYEVNIADQHQNPDNRTGSIVSFSAPDIAINAPSQWNTMTISAVGTHITVDINGQTVSSLNNESYKNGVIAIQYGGHSKDIRFRNFTITPL